MTVAHAAGSGTIPVSRNHTPDPVRESVVRYVHPLNPAQVYGILSI